MNIGWISQALPYLPCTGGFRLYGGNLIKRLSQRHTIDLISLLEPGDEDHLDWPRQYCRSVETLPPEGRRWLSPFNLASMYVSGRPLRFRREMERIIGGRARDWDVIHVEGEFVGGMVPGGLDLPQVLSLHDAEVLRCRELLRCKLTLRQRALNHLRLLWEPRYDRLVYPRFERCVLVAQRDLEVVRALVPDARPILIPYGTDTDYFRPTATKKRPFELVFHSHFGYPPNIEAALEFANEVFPLVRRQCPEAVFHLVGARPGAEIRALAERPGIRLSADLPDLRQEVSAAAVYVCAIHYGTGLKSKVLEAMAMRMPIVCYPGSTVGLDCEHGKNLMVAENPQQFAEHVVRLLRDPALAAALAAAGRQLVENEYSWDARTRTYENLYQDLISSGQELVGSLN